MSQLAHTSPLEQDTTTMQEIITESKKGKIFLQNINDLAQAERQDVYSEIGTISGPNDPDLQPEETRQCIVSYLEVGSQGRGLVMELPKTQEDWNKINKKISRERGMIDGICCITYSFFHKDTRLVFQGSIN